MADHYRTLAQSLVNIGFLFRRQGEGRREIWRNRQADQEVTFDRDEVTKSRPAAEAVLAAARALLQERRQDRKPAKPAEKADNPASPPRAEPAAKSVAKSAAKSAVRSAVKSFGSTAGSSSTTARPAKGPSPRAPVKAARRGIKRK